MRNRFIIVVSGLTFVLGATALAQQGFVPPQSGARFLERYRPVTARDGKIIGTVSDSAQMPVKGGRLQVRDLSTGRIVQQGTSNENGEFEFTILEPGTYVVEMVSPSGFVIALSPAGTLARYETFETRVQVPGRWDYSRQGVVIEQNVAMYLGVSGMSTITGRTLELAVEQNISTRDAGEPVSP